MSGQLVKVVRFDEESEQAILTLANELREYREVLLTQGAEIVEMIGQLATEIKEALSLEMQDLEQEWSLDGE